MNDLDRLAADLERAGRDALSDALTETLSNARRASSGFTSPADLRRMGHPYARRHGRTLLDPFVINAQSGKFLQAWARSGPQEERGALTGLVTNSDPKGELLGRGTRTMLGRPLADVLQPEAEQALTEALERRLERIG